MWSWATSAVVWQRNGGDAESEVRCPFASCPAHASHLNHKLPQVLPPTNKEAHRTLGRYSPAGPRTCRRHACTRMPPCARPMPACTRASINPPSVEYGGCGDETYIMHRLGRHHLSISASQHRSTAGTCALLARRLLTPITAARRRCWRH
ncbi:hypothetical protein BS50DRAFT_39578 [Corynespora cassiicola Philippines]|uniref:Uncharacterized protein n=1 Tax=Corynespora cassiicola Philippines TaxID=1448308 RepID=A0A2T2PCZ5_CORCC|nr:hypothetical protein BS50DRAFT_39578 [Corynespora cassiicola Philippines]